MQDHGGGGEHPGGSARVLETQARLAVQAAGLGLWEWDVPGGAFRIDARFAEMLGRPELTGVAFDAGRIADMTHPEDREMVAAELAKALERNEHGFETVHRALTPQGDLVWLRARAAVTARTDDGAPLLVVGVVEDCTQTKQEDLARAEERRRHDLVIKGAQMAVWEWRPDHDAVTWSERLNEIMGLPLDRPGETIEAFNARVHPDDIAPMREAAGRTVRTGEPYEQEFRVRNAETGDWITLRSRAAAELDADGQAQRIAGTITDVTALHAAREQAALEARRVRLALDAGGLAAFDFDFQRGAMLGSPQIAEILGEPRYADGVVPLQHLLDIIHPDDREQAAARLEDARAEGGDFVSEHRIIRPDGQVVWTWTHATPVARFADGRVSAFTGVAQDLTQRKQSELALSEANDRFEKAVESSLIAIWDWDLQTGRVHWSPRLYELLKLDPEDRIETLEDISPLFHPEDLDRLRETQRRHFEDREPFELEYRMIAKDGEIIRVLARGAASRNEAGEPVRFVGSLMDITAHRAAQEAARLAGARAQYALDAARLGLWEFDPRTGSVVMDAHLADLLGRPDLADTPLGADAVFGFTQAEDLNTVKAALAALNRGETDVIRSEHRVVNADGERIWILAHVGAAERDEAGKPVRVIGITQDLRPQKQVEDALRDAKDRAEAANEVKSAFLATMSHEIRTPLNGVLGMAQLLMTSPLDDTQRRYAETILSSGRSLSAIIDDVLDISRIEAGKMMLDPSPTDLEDMVETAMKPSWAAAEAKGLTLSVEIDPALHGPRRLDATRMGQVLTNLVSNAVKFTPAGQVRVRASSRQPDRVRFEVDDDGPGVKDDDQARIFERFTQADMSTRRAHGGSGLGLAIARELTEMAGGAIGVDSTPGQGALFWFEIPAPPCDARREDGDVARHDANPAGARVLVVEDHPVNRAATLELLDCSGFTPLEACNTTDALALLRAEPVDAALLDLHMPGQGGDQVLEAIRAGQAGRRDLPVFFVSADVTTSARERAAKLGADGYFAKPMDYERLRRALVEAIETGRGG